MRTRYNRAVERMISWLQSNGMTRSQAIRHLLDYDYNY